LEEEWLCLFQVFVEDTLAAIEECLGCCSDDVVEAAACRVVGTMSASTASTMAKQQGCKSQEKQVSGLLEKIRSCFDVKFVSASSLWGGYTDIPVAWLADPRQAWLQGHSYKCLVSGTADRTIV